MGDKKVYFEVKGLIINEDKALLVHKINESNEDWELVGGRMQFGENTEETLLRKVKEETGLTVEPIKLEDTWNYVSSSYQVIGIIYICKSKDRNVILSDEYDSYKWVDVDSKISNNIHRIFKSRMQNWNWDEINKFIEV